MSIDGPAFVRALYGTKAGETLTTRHSGVSSGNQLVYVDRRAEYDDAALAPMFDEFAAALSAKYGAASFEDTSYDGTTFYWMFKDGALGECDPYDAPQCLPPESAITLIDQASAYSDLILYASVTRSIYNESRVGGLQIASTDLALKLAADAADAAGLLPALEKAVSTSEEDAATPEL